MVIEGTKQDRDWRNGDYTTEPRAAVQIDADFLMIAGGAPMLMQKNLPTREQTDNISRRKFQAHHSNTRPTTSARRERVRKLWSLGEAVNDNRAGHVREYGG
jgi:homoserine acetyltransferase